MQSDKGSISLAFTFRTRAENHHINKACSLLLPRLISVQTEHCFRTPALLYNRYAAPAKRPTKGGLLPSRVPWRGQGVPPQRERRERGARGKEKTFPLTRALSLFPGCGIRSPPLAKSCSDGSCLSVCGANSLFLGFYQGSRPRKDPGVAGEVHRLHA